MKRGLNIDYDTFLKVRQERDELRSQLDKAGGRACPCLYLDEPCHEGCTCRNGASSLGCVYCATYGGIEQRKEKARWLAERINGYEQLKKQIIGFANWYSGMAEAKVIRAYNRYLAEAYKPETEEEWKLAQYEAKHELPLTPFEKPFDAIRTVLEECEEYMDSRADADHNGESLVPNKEMRLLSEIRNCLEKLK